MPRGATWLLPVFHTGLRVSNTSVVQVPGSCVGTEAVQEDGDGQREVRRQQSFTLMFISYTLRKAVLSKVDAIQPEPSSSTLQVLPTVAGTARLPDPASRCAPFSYLLSLAFESFNRVVE